MWNYRFTWTRYKDHYACFSCRKTFKRRLFSDIKGAGPSITEAKCPQCGELMANMGKDFESPKKTDIKAWQHIENLRKVCITFFSCGCKGPAYLPHDQESLITVLKEMRDSYSKELEFWQNRLEPETKEERLKDEQRNWHKLSEIRDDWKKLSVKNQEGIDYWSLCISQIEKKISLAMERNYYSIIAKGQ